MDNPFKIFIVFIKQYLFWMLFFILGRVVFLFYNFSKLVDADFTDVLKIFWHALYLDTSTACYLLCIPFMLLFFQSLIKHPFPSIINNYYSYLIIILISIITSSELGLYEEWGRKLNMRALSHLREPSEVFESAKTCFIVIAFILTVFQSFAGIWFYKRLIREPIKLQKRNYFLSLLFLIAIPPVLGVGIRGGLQPIPIQSSDVYFSSNNYLNLAAVNSLWNLGSSLDKNWKYKVSNPFNYYELQEAHRVRDSLFTNTKDTTYFILKTNRPNIILIILEGWSADVCRSTGGFEGAAPYFDKMAKQGIIFTNCYAQGTLSDEGVASILSGFPSQPETIIITQPDKFQQLPCLGIELRNAGFHTSFHYGGQLSYGNIRGYIYFNRFDKIIELKDFTDDIPRGKLGVHDEFLLNRWYNDINTFSQPFFAAAFTLSSHSPYDHSMKPVLDWGGDMNDYINAVYYADSCISLFMEKAKKQAWYGNTLFIFVSDHGHLTPKPHEWQAPDSRKIPMLLFGQAIKEEYRGQVFKKLCCQTDLAATLLVQLNLDSTKFKRSRNIFKPYYHEFAYYAFDFGFGFIKANGDFFVYDHENNRYYFKQFSKATDEQHIIREGKSYLEILFDEYLQY
ncbi:MAG: LTA synthase family protein [Bacteroidia bacterium]|nr:LTA synthase family protein [Bacteroidia bacterium]